MPKIEPIEQKKQRRLIITWAVTFLVVFPLLIFLGYLMRSSQGELQEVNHNTFYAIMTLHGLGMIGLLYSFSFAGLWYLISIRYVRLNLKIGYSVYVIILISLLGLAYTTIIGKFGAGWYLLYPLPFVGTNWSASTTILTTISLIVMGLGWLLGILHVIYAMAKEYRGFTNLLGWQYLRKGKVEKKLPALLMIATISLTPGIFAILAGAVLLIMYLLQAFEPTLSFDPLLMKNMVMFFGHTMANITMYCAVGWVYALLPKFTGRDWSVDKILVYSWNATFFFIVFAFFHHMYMDFVQPLSFQYIGQIASYTSAIPATAITMFGVIKQVYHSGIKWHIVPLLFLFGVAGWAIGGFAAVVDSTIFFNNVLHNTLWVPAHFHTYLLMGVVLFILGFLFYIFSSPNDQDKSGLAKTGFWIYLLGGYGFLLMFYLGGLKSIPRRYSSYSGVEIDSTYATGVHLAQISVWFIALLTIGLLLMYISLFTKLFERKTRSNHVILGSTDETNP